MDENRRQSRSFFGELRRRNVFRAAAAYVAVAWLVMQVAETILPIFGLGDAALRVLVIVLVVGFAPAVALSWVFELTPEGVRRDRELEPGGDLSVRTKRMLDRGIVVVLALGFAYFGFDKFVLDPVRDEALVEEARQQGREEALTGSYGDRSIAVLAFENLSGSDEQSYFSDGLADTVLHQLAQVPGLRVIARNSSFQFKGTHLDVREIGKRLGVAHVLEGSVQRSGDQVRVIAQLVRSDDGSHVWSRRFDYKFDDIFALHDEIALAVTDELEISLRPADVGKIEMGGTSDPQAYDLLVQAQGAHDAALVSASIDEIDPDKGYLPMQLIDRALELDPDYVDALIDKAWIYQDFAFLASNTVLFREHLERMGPLVERALELAPDYSSAWSIKGAFERRRGNHQEANQALSRAIKLNPNDADAHAQLAVLKLRTAPLETIELMRIARELDPAGAFYRPTVLALLKLNRVDEALTELEANVDHPSDRQLVIGDLSVVHYEVLGRPDESARWSGLLYSNQPNDTDGISGLAQAWQAVGDYSRARKWLAEGARMKPDADDVKILEARLSIVQTDWAAARAAIASLSDSTTRYALGWLSIVCLASGDLTCARDATRDIETAYARADVRTGADSCCALQIREATLRTRLGEPANASAEEIIRRTRSMPRTSYWDDIRYSDAEAHVLLGKYEAAVKALEETLLSDGGFIPLDSFLLPADRGYVLSEMEGNPHYEDWRERFRKRRDAARQRMIEMEKAGDIPVPPG